MKTTHSVSMRSLLACALILLSTLGTGAQSKRQRVVPLVIRNVTLIDMRGATDGAASQAGMTVVVRGERIAEIGRASSVRVPDGAQVLDGAGKFLLPGLWDMHVHMASLPPFERNEKIFLPLFVANGVTGVRDMGGDLDVLLKWRAKIASGELAGPRIVAVAGPMLDGYIWPASQSVTNEAEGREAVAGLKRRGADFVKVQSLLARDVYFAIAAEARKQGMTFAGHVPETVSAREASDAGQKSIEHLTGVLQASSSMEDALPKGLKATAQLLETYDAARAAALFASFRRNATWQCPTLVWERGYFTLDADALADESLLRFIPRDWEEKIWKDFKRDALRQRTPEDRETLKRRLRKELEVVGAMHRAGVGLLAGTDTPAPYIFPGSSLHDELALLVEAGLTPFEALQTATRNPARFTGKLDTHGTIERRKMADLLLLDADPLADIKHTRRIDAVIIGGKLYTKPMLRRMLAGVAEAAGRN
jgi:imidazolonepropionase-like amidohydrolase